MEWENYHLRQFIVGATRFGGPDLEYEGDMK
jgi:hypothetical protein